MPPHVTLPELSVTAGSYYDNSWMGGVNYSHRYEVEEARAEIYSSTVNSVGALFKKQVTDVYGLPDPFNSKSIPTGIPIIGVTDNIPSSLFQKAEFRKDSNGNTYYSLASGKEEIDITNLPGYYNLNIKPEDKTFHKYEMSFIVCFVSNPKCTPDNIHRVIRENPAPLVTYSPGNGVVTGSVSPIPGVGNVVHYVDPEKYTLTNVTLDDHIMYPGLVFQQIYQDRDIIGIRYIGVGNGFSQFGSSASTVSDIFGYYWPLHAFNVSRAVSDLNATTGLPIKWNSLSSGDSYPQPVDTPILSSAPESISKNFDSLQYLAANPGLAQALGTIDQVVAADHYIYYGRAEGRATSFDYLQYLAANPGLAQALGGVSAETAEQHYINSGYREGRPIHFESLRYVASYGDLIRVIGDNKNQAKLHFINFGYQEGRFISFDPVAYRQHNPDVEAFYGNDLASILLHYIRHGYFEGRDNGSGHPLASPVILDLDGTGIDISLHGTSTVTFDVMGTGTPLPTAWAGAHSGMLVIDLDAQGNPGADGRITLQHEVDFSSAAAEGLPFNPTYTPSDMQALAELYDTNGNHQLDPGDARWNEFRVWQDHSQNGVTDVDELHTLTDLSITAIGLLPSGEVQHLADGTIIRGTSFYTLSDGTTRTAADVQLAYGLLPDKTHTRSVAVQSDLSQVSYKTNIVRNDSGSEVGQIDLSQNTDGFVMDLNETSLTASFLNDHGAPLRSVIGSTGDDFLLAGQDSHLTGDAGSDVFGLARATGHIYITDLHLGEDKIYFSLDQFNNFESLKESAVQIGDDLNISINVDTVITIHKVNLEHINSGLFLFV